jgi:PAS domain S-box-containing protein
MMSDVLDAVLTSFDCDRAFLVYPCDPETTSYRVPMERTRPEFPGALARGLEVPVDPESARVFRAARASSGPVTFDPGSEPPLPTYLTERFRVQSQLAMAVYPKVAKPYMFGLHQCSNPRIWTADEKSLFQAIGWRLADGLTSLLAYRDVRESEERYRRIVDTAAEGIWVLGPDTMTTFVNARMAEMLAYSDEEMIGRPTTDFMFEDDAADHLRMMENRRHGLSETYERRFRRKDGATVWTMASGTPAFDDEHRFGGTFAMFTDITERKRAEEALRKSEERLRLEVARMPIAYIVWDTDFRVVTWNPAAERIFGFTFDEARGRHPYGMIVPPEAQPHVDDIWNRLLEGDASAHSVNENTTKDGRTIVCDWTNTPLKHPDGAVLGVMSMVQDITERVRAEEEIVRVNRALCMLSDTNQALIHITDEAALLNEVCRIAVDVGGSLMAWVGFAEHDEAKTLRPVAYAGGDAEYVESARVSWADDERGRGPGGTAVRTGRPSIFHSLSTDPAFAPWREAAIQRGYRSIVSLPLISEAQTLGALLIYAGEEDAFDSREVEILEELADDLAFGLTALRTRARRDEAEEALHKREAELNESQRLAHIGSFDWDAVKDTIWWSAEYFRIYGLDPGRPAADYVGHLDAYTAESAQRLDAVVKRTMETGEPYEVDLELAHPTASTRWIVARGEAKRDAEGRISGIRGTAQNITEHMRLEGDLRQSQKMDAVGRLAGGVAHDFNNLLTAILGYGHLLDARLAESGAGREEVTEILQAGERAAVLTRQLLAFSRKQVLAPVVFRVNDLIADFEKMLRRMIGEDITLVTRLGSDANHVLADPGQIEQVLMNLAVNARDAMPRGGTLTIETEGAEVEPDVSGAPSAISPGRYVVITVRDTGTGMDAATQARIFEPFFTTKEKGKGTGLGLSTVYGIVKQSNGAIQVSSKPGEGSTFRVYLPQAGDATPRAFSRSSDSTPAFGTETILVVDDEPSVGGVTRRALERYGYRVLLVSSGAEALELARKAEPIHLLLTDVVMPGMSGTALAGQLKELRPDLRLLFMSGYAADETALSGAALDNFIQKPFTPESLARRVREILSADRSSEAPA